MSRDKDLERLKTMGHGDMAYINWSEEGGGEVHCVYDVYILFEVPQYGGEPQYVATYYHCQEEELLGLVYSWT